MAKTLEARFANNYVAAGGKNVGAIPWALIIEALLSLFGDCPAKRAKRWVRMFPDAAAKAVDDKLKGDAMLASTASRTATSKAAVKTFLSMSEAEIESLR